MERYKKVRASPFLHLKALDCPYAEERRSINMVLLRKNVENIMA